MQQGLTAAHAKQKDCHWEIWHECCLSCAIDPFLRNVNNPKPFLQVFGSLHQHGTISASGKPVAASTAQDVVRSVGQKFARMGAKDPRLDVHGNVDHRLNLQF